MNKRESQFDLLRTMAMFMVIAIHVLGNVTTVASEYNTAWYIWQISSAFLMTCNPLFFISFMIAVFLNYLVFFPLKSKFNSRFGKMIFRDDKFKNTV